MTGAPRRRGDKVVGPQTFLDAAGTHHTPADANARIVSLVPSITETLFALQLGEAIVGRTAFCVHPREHIGRVPSVGGTKRINLAKLRALAPTHVIVNVDETPRSLADTLAAAGYTVIVTHPIEVRDNLSLYQLLGRLFGRQAQADALCRELERADAYLAAIAPLLPRRRVLYLIWKDPWMTVSTDTYIARMLARIRWLAVAGVSAARYPTIVLENALLAKADLVLFSTEPFPFSQRHLTDFALAYPAHADKAMLIDAEMTSWYGCRAIAGIRYPGDLAQRLAA